MESRDQEIAEWLDNRFTIPGTNIQFGIDPILGLMPGAGDWLAGVISLYFLVQGTRKGGRSPVLVRMFLNIVLDVIIGSIPVLGEVFDIYWKANVRNAELLRELETNPDQTTRLSHWFNWTLLVVFSLIILGLLFAISWIIIALFDAVIHLL